MLDCAIIGDGVDDQRDVLPEGKRQPMTTVNRPALSGWNKSFDALALGMTVMLGPRDTVDNSVGYPQSEVGFARPKVSVPMVADLPSAGQAQD